MKNTIFSLLLVASIIFSDKATAQGNIAAGGSHSLFLCNNNLSMSVGYNLYGQLGDGTTTQRNAPVQVSTLTDIVALGEAEHHSLFLKNDGIVRLMVSPTF